MTKLLKCPFCETGELQYIEEVFGSFVYDIDEDGKTDRHEYHGDSWASVRCSRCETQFDFISDGEKIILGEELI